MKHYYQSVEGWFEYGPLYRDVVLRYDHARFVEVGCWKGRSTSFMGVEILNSGKDIKLDVVDTFQGSTEHGAVDSTALKAEFWRNVDPVKSVIGYVHEMTSVEASRLYEPNSLDFVFIDASHDYWNVAQDIVHWYPRIRNGGMIGGDDFEPAWPGVVQAVEEIFGKDRVAVYGKRHWGITKG